MVKFTHLAAAALPLALMACGGGDRGGVAATRAAQEQACTAAVADQVGTSAAGFQAIFQGTSPAGNAVIAVTPTEGPENTYTCEVDASLTVLNLTGSSTSDDR